MAVYLVQGPSGSKLVEAKTKAGAINAVIEGQYEAKALSPMEAIISSQSGVELLNMNDTKEAA